MIKVVVNGAGGRMGREVIRAALEDDGVAVVGAFEASGSPLLGRGLRDIFGDGAPDVLISPQRSEVVAEGDAVIDFSAPEATLSLLPMARDAETALVIGTTGFEADGLAAIRRLSEIRPVLLSPNLSEGINAMFAVLPEFLALLGDGWDVEIVERHHRDKIDSPSGTALRFGELIAESRGRSLEEVARFGREGRSGPRGDDEICFHSIRAGEIPGAHRIVFSKGEEEIEIQHRVHGRQVFARGALLAAKRLAGREAGLYSWRDLIDDR